MLSLFPEILFLSPFAATILRVALAVTLGYISWQHLSGAGIMLRVLGVLEVVAAVAIFAGAWTQAAALGAFFLIVIPFFARDARFYSRSTMALAAVIALSIVLTGAGALAFDLPL